MPVHDWTRVEAGIFHDFHSAWITELRNTLNGGLLPKNYYALSEQHAGRYVGDLITLHASAATDLPPLPPATGGLAVADAPPQVRLRTTLATSPRMRRRTLAIRHVSGHRLVAILEIVSPSNKDRAEHVEELAAKIVAALEAGIHVLLVDLWPPGAFDPRGIHGAVRDWFDALDGPYRPPANEPLTLASYCASPPAEVFVEHLAVGRRLPEMPLFFHADRYINIPLEATYQAAFDGTPAFWRDVLNQS
ncbi:MAG TPA: DUF4058 family protein [Pirellulales bacterium]|nr:DUF4058 family protein [Pirellulales bacterium]